MDYGQVVPSPSRTTPSRPHRITSSYPLGQVRAGIVTDWVTVDLTRTLHKCGICGEANPGPLDYRVSAYTDCATEPPGLVEGKTLLRQCAGPLHLAGPC